MMQLIKTPNYELLWKTSINSAPFPFCNCRHEYNCGRYQQKNVIYQTMVKVDGKPDIIYFEAMESLR